MISGMMESRILGNSVLLMILIPFASICALIVGLLFSFAVIRKEEETKEIDFSIYCGVALFLIGIVLFITGANERHLPRTIVLWTMIIFIKWGY
jgi:branched-subunit amino acid ABC-type transport system permease component